MFGGQLESGVATNLLYILTVDDKGLKWVNGHSICKGKFPEPRFDHTMEILHQSIVIIGGRDEQKFVNTIYALDFGKLTWTRIKCGEENICRAEHCSVVSSDQDKIFVFGGISEDFKLSPSTQVIIFPELTKGVKGQEINMRLAKFCVKKN